METTFTCADCKQAKPVQREGGTGYATLLNGDNVCYACIAIRDVATMIETGNSRNLPLYLNKPIARKEETDHKWQVSNWPGTLTFPVYYIRKGHHNIAGSRVDFWFNGPDGFVWHGYQLGEWTQIAHCKRTREVIRKTA